MADFSTLVETFASLSTTRWTISDATVAGGELLIPPINTNWSLYTKAAWALASTGPASGVVEFVPYATRNNGNAGWGLTNASNQGLVIEQTSATTYRSMIFDAGSIFGTTTITTDDRFWRVYYDGSVAYIESSADASTWTARGTKDMTSSNTGFSWNPNLDNSFIMRFRLVSGTGATGLPTFRGINEPTKTSVAAVVATSSALTRIPVVQQWTTINAVAATSSAAAPAPTLVAHLPVPSAATAATVFPPPAINLPVPTSLSPPVATALSQAFVPTVSTPVPTTITASVATASILLLPPGDYVRMVAPPATVSSRLLPLLRVGPAFSRFANTVVQTAQNWGGAEVYYRLNDQTATLTDSLGLTNGGWSGTRNLVTGAVVGDDNKAMEFNGTSTLAYNGLMPRYDPFFAADQGFRDGGRTQWRRDEWPRIWGYSAMVAFRTLPGATKTLYLFSRDTPGIFRSDLSLRVEGGRVAARWYFGTSGDWQDLLGASVNDGAWHLAVMTSGYPMDDDLDLGHQKVNRLYLDGVLQGTLNVASSVPTRPLSLGGVNGVASMEGALDEFAEFDYALSAWDVRELWNQLNNLSGPALRLDVPLVTTRASAPAPTVRKSVVRPLNTFFDDFEAPFLDLSKWRDASPTAQVVGGAAVLRANGERLLTQDYFQVKDSTFVVRLDRLPLREGHMFLGLVNEYDIVPDDIFGGINKGDALRPHRTIGFDIYRSTALGRTTTTLSFSSYGVSIGYGSKTRSISIPYVPDDPNYPSPHKWLRLDIDPGAHGGATWYTSADGVTWDERYDVHGGKVNVSISPSIGPDGKAILDSTGAVVTETTTTYEDTGSFYLFDPGIGPSDRFPGGLVNVWQGYMRVLIQVDRGNAAATAQVDNVNVLPTGTGTPAEMLAKPVRVQTSSSTEYLLYALNPRVYNSATDITVEAPLLRASARFLTPPEPVYVFTPALTAQTTLLAPQRAGDALPVQVLADVVTVQARAVTPTHAGQAQDYVAEPNQATAFYLAHEPAVDTSQSSPAPVSKPRQRVITLKVRKVRASITQN